MSNDFPMKPVKRWTAKRKSAVVLEILSGKKTAAAVARQHDLTVAEIETWKARFLDPAEEGLRNCPQRSFVKSPRYLGFRPLSESGLPNFLQPSTLIFRHFSLNPARWPGQARSPVKKKPSKIFRRFGPIGDFFATKPRTLVPN